MKVEKVGVVGCGLMGRGIAEVFATAGYETVVRELSQDLLERGLEALTSSLDRSVAKERLTESEREEIVSRIEGVIEVEALASCDLIVEAIVERFEDKRDLFRRLDGVVDGAAILATNTSSLTVTRLAASTEHPERVIGLHFFNPVPAMRLVEIVRTLLTDPDVVATAKEVVESLGKVAAECGDNSGFIVNRLLVPYLLDAVRAHESGVGSLEDIDQAMKFGCGYPMGPFQLLDLIGLDTALSIADIMFEEYREARFAPPPLLRQMVHAGRLGRKSGQGFYSYG